MTAAASAPPLPPLALCLGGLDPSAGAGLLRDVMTLAALGVQPMAVPTCTTIQNGAGCQGILEAPDPLPFLEALAPHLGGRWGVKLGLCALAGDRLQALAAWLDRHGPALRIWDPILAPTSGVGLHDPDGLRRMARSLLPGGGWVVSPNRPEAAALSGLDGPDPEALARPLLEWGAAAVWLKGGHGPDGTVEDFWITRQGPRSLGQAPRLAGDRRGTGCTLAATWLGLALKGLEPEAAASEAAARLRGQWSRAFAPGGFGRPSFAPVGA